MVLQIVIILFNLAICVLKIFKVTICDLKTTLNKDNSI